MASPLSPGRRTVLTFGIPFCVLMIGYGVLSLVNVMGLTGYTDSRSVTPQAKVLKVTADEGYLHLQPSSDGDVHVRLSGHYTLHKPTLSVVSSSAGVTIKGTCPNLIDEICSQDMTIDVPADFAVTARSSGGSVRTRGLTGALDLHSSAGDVEADGAVGTLVLSSSAGDVTSDAVHSTDVSATSSAGDVDLTFAVVPDRVTAHSSAGDVNVAVPGSASYRVIADDPDGPTVDVPVSSASTHVINASSSAGDVTVAKP